MHHSIWPLLLSSGSGQEGAGHTHHDWYDINWRPVLVIVAASGVVASLRYLRRMRKERGTKEHGTHS